MTLDSLSVFGLPRELWHCTLDNFDYDRAPGLERVVAWFQRAWQESPRPPHLILFGPPGLGKSHLSVALYRWAIARSDLSHCCWLRVPAFCMDVKSSFDEGDDPWAWPTGADRYVALDDLWGRDHTTWELDHVVYRLIDTAHANRAAIVVTTNLSFEGLQARLAPHEMSRLVDGARWVEFTGQDRRWESGE